MTRRSSIASARTATKHAPEGTRLRAFITAGAALSLAACAALSGLDQITESACAPDCVDDAGVEASAGDDAVTERSQPDAEEAAVDRQSPADVATGSDSEPVADTGPDAVADAAGDAAADGGCGTVYLSESFDSPAPGWTLDTSWSIAATCASPPAPQKGNPDPTVDHTTGAAGGVVGAGVYAMSCWNVDDVTLTSAVCP